jgi:hypothetical protein
MQLACVNGGLQRRAQRLRFSLRTFGKTMERNRFFRITHGGDDALTEIALRNSGCRHASSLRERLASREPHQSDRSACITSTRAARAAGRMDATIAAASSTRPEAITGSAPGIRTSSK